MPTWSCPPSKSSPSTSLHRAADDLLVRQAGELARAAAAADHAALLVADEEGGVRAPGSSRRAARRGSRSRTSSSPCGLLRKPGRAVGRGRPLTAVGADEQMRHAAAKGNRRAKGALSAVARKARPDRPGGSSRGAGRRGRWRSARAACAGGSPAAAGRARRRPRSCPAPRRPRRRASTARPGRRRSARRSSRRISRSSRSRPVVVDPSRSSAAPATVRVDRAVAADLRRSRARA